MVHEHAILQGKMANIEAWYVDTGLRHHVSCSVYHLDVREPPSILLGGVGESPSILSGGVGEPPSTLLGMGEPLSTLSGVGEPPSTLSGVGSLWLHCWVV